MKNMSFSLVILSCLALNLSAADFKLGVVDYNRVLNGVDEGKAAKEKLQKEKDKNDKDLAKRKTELEEMRGKLTDLDTKMRSNMLSKEQQAGAQKLEQEFNKKLAEAAQLNQKYNEDIFAKETAETQDILRKIQPIADDLGRAGGFTLVLEKKESGIVYANEATDLTEKVIQKYNSQYKAGSKTADAKK